MKLIYSKPSVNSQNSWPAYPLSHEKRIIRDLKSFNDEPENNTYIKLIDENDTFHMEALIIITDECPYKNGKFIFDIYFPNDYAFRPTEYKLRNKIYHPNFDLSGHPTLKMLYTVSQYKF